MRLYDVISQSDLESVVDGLLDNFHVERVLDLDSPTNDYCTLGFDLAEGVDAGGEVIFNGGDELIISCTGKRLSGLDYSLRLYYYVLDKVDIEGTKQYGDLRTVTVELDDDTVRVPFTSDQVYLQKSFDLILFNSSGYRVELTTPSTVVTPGEDVVLSADVTFDGVPFEDASVSFYNGESLLGTASTGEDGSAVFRVSGLVRGSYSFSSVCEGAYSNNVVVTVPSDHVLEFTVTGSTFWTDNDSPFSFNGRCFVDWGDGSPLVEYSNGYLYHSFIDGASSHNVKVYANITTLGWGCFSNCTNLTSIIIPDSVTSLESYCFYRCIGLTSINLNWNDINTIIPYNNTWIQYTPAELQFHIPQNTTNLYTQKSYPTNKLVEGA